MRVAVAALQATLTGSLERHEGAPTAVGVRAVGRAGDVQGALAVTVLPSCLHVCPRHPLGGLRTLLPVSIPVLEAEARRFTAFFSGLKIGQAYRRLRPATHSVSELSKESGI